MTTAKVYDMIINVKKSKVMRVTRNGRQDVNIFVEGQKVEQVAKFKYLGSIISEDGRSADEVRVRIWIAKDALIKIKELFVRNMSRGVKKRIVKTLIWSVLLYGSENWTL